MSIGYKWKRFLRWKSRIGFWQAARFELLWSLRKHCISVRVPGIAGSVAIRRASSDISVFETVFIERELGSHLPENPKLIIDGGANVGFSSLFYGHRFPQAKIMAVEPSDSNTKMLRKNCSTLTNVTVIQGGVVVAYGISSNRKSI